MKSSYRSDLFMTHLFPPPLDKLCIDRSVSNKFSTMFNVQCCSHYSYKIWTWDLFHILFSNKYSILRHQFTYRIIHSKFLPRFPLRNIFFWDLKHSCITHAKISILVQTKTALSNTLMIGFTIADTWGLVPCNLYGLAHTKFEDTRS